MENSDLVLPAIVDGEDKSSPFKNRIRKNYRHLRKWAKRTVTDCFRIYDRDVKGYPVAIDFYAGRFCVQYFSKNSELQEAPSELQDEVNQTLRDTFDVSVDAIFWRTRKKRAKVEQYEKVDEQKEFFVVREYGVLFKVNLQDYLDTGLFLDHRETRHYIASIAKGKRVLNLFAYTCSFSVQVAMAGALFTKSVDLSNTYTAWGRDNFILNGLPLKNHEIVRADCLKFLDDELRSREKYDLIIIDPPTISRSKKMDQMFDVQVDYVPLIEKAVKLLSEGGVLFFSTNFRKFSFKKELFPECMIQEVSEKTIPLDFRNEKIHRCWKISKRVSGGCPSGHECLHD